MPYKAKIPPLLKESLDLKMIMVFLTRKDSEKKF